MRHLPFKSISLIIFIFLAGNIWAQKIEDGMCFYYGNRLPEEMLAYCKYIVVDDKNLEEKPVVTYDLDTKYIAYLSVGESLDKAIAKDWVLGVNKRWDSKVMDLTNRKYFDYLLARAKRLLTKDYGGIFLDTLDSATLFLKGEKLEAYFEQEVKLIKTLRKLFPQKLIILNRGFEIIPKVFQDIDALAVESLFWGYDAVNQSYVPVKSEEREKLLVLLKGIKSKYKLPIIVIDYLKPGEMEKGLELSQKIQQLGFIPYISNGELNALGINEKCIYPRKVLILTDGSVYNDIYKNSPSRLISLPLEYLGFVPEIKNVSRSLPEFPLKDRYAGIIVWLNKGVLEDYSRFYVWVKRAIAEGNKVLFLESFGFPEEKEFLNPLGLDLVEVQDKNFNLWFNKKYLGFEIEPRIRAEDTGLVLQRGEPWLMLKNKKEQITLMAKTPWGGYAWGESFLLNSPEEIWVVDPFQLVQEMLELPLLPIPDVSTEMGKRIFIAHIDGDGAVSRAEFEPDKLAAEIIYSKILKKYTLPHGVSFIEAEIAPHGLYPQLSAKMLTLVKKIWQLPYVEPASHSYSHPYQWKKVLLKKEELEDTTGEFYNLPLKNYTLNLEREIIGSVDFLSQLTSKPLRLFFWTGDCLPTENALKIAYKQGLYNINGGDTTITNQEPWFSRIAPLGFKRGKFIQIFAPEQNENLYTNLWRGPFYGYKQVIQTFLKTESPKRLKPIDIYYHFYSGSKLASLKVLEEVYNFCLQQDIHPLYVSEFLQRALAFYNSVILKTSEGLEVVKKGKYFGLDFNLGTLRLSQESIVSNSWGRKQDKNLYYYHLEPDSYRIKVSTKSNLKNKKEPYLISLNGKVLRFKKYKQGFDFKFTSFRPVKGELFLPDGCRLDFKNKVKVKKKVDTYVFQSKEKTVAGRITCRQ